MNCAVCSGECTSPWGSLQLEPSALIVKIPVCGHLWQSLLNELEKLFGSPHSVQVVQPFSAQIIPHLCFFCFFFLLCTIMCISGNICDIFLKRFEIESVAAYVPGRLSVPSIRNCPNNKVTVASHWGLNGKVGESGWKFNVAAERKKKHTYIDVLL